MQTESITFHTWRRNLRAAGYLAACGLASYVLSLWLTPRFLAVAVGAFVCALCAFCLSIVQVRTKRYLGPFQTLFSVFSMLIVTQELAPPGHHCAAIWQVGSLYIAVWFGLLFVFRQTLVRRLDVTHDA